MMRLRDKRHRRTLVAFAVAVAVTAVAGSVFQTQVNLADIAALGAPLTPGLRALTTAEDLVGFGPIMAGIAAGAFIPALSVGGFAARRFPPAWRTPIMAAAGAVGIWCAIAALGLFLPMANLFGALRGAVGLPLICASGLLGGTVFAVLTHRARALT